LCPFFPLYIRYRFSGLWPDFNNGGNLLFERDDFAPPYSTGVWKRLAGLGDPDINRIAKKLMDCCAPDWVASKSLQDTLAANWWEQAGAPAQATTSTAPPAGLTKTAATESRASTPTAGPSPSAVPGLTWYKASAVGQSASPTGSLPPPPTVPYQSAVAPQSGKTSTAGSGSNWYKQQQAKAPAPAPWPVPASKPKNPQRNNSEVITAWVVSVLVVIILIIIAVSVAAGH
jgi:hypothetical protein